MKKNNIDKSKIEAAVTMILEAIGENPNREGVRDTPRRVASMYEEIFYGMEIDPRELLQVSFTEYHDELVLVKDIPLYSMCEHHFLPFYGKAHVAYIPKGGKVVGISKIARVLKYMPAGPAAGKAYLPDSRLFYETLKPHGVAVIIEAETMCMTMRGVNKPGSHTITSAVRGIFETRAQTRNELLSLIMKK